MDGEEREMTVAFAQSGRALRRYKILKTKLKLSKFIYFVSVKL
jgi:hypothetical protein